MEFKSIIMIHHEQEILLNKSKRFRSEASEASGKSCCVKNTVLFETTEAVNREMCKLFVPSSLSEG